MMPFRLEGFIARWLLSLAMLLAPLPAHAWDAEKSSSNLGVPALSAAELATRKITPVAMGLLEVPTGAIVVADPLVTPDRDALERRIKPGRYPVVLYQAQGSNALAMLRIAPGNPVRWELATLAGQDVSTLKDDEIFGYPVDAGTGSFFDKTAWPLMEEREKREIAAGAQNFNYYDDVLAKDYPGEASGEYVMHRPLPENPLNVAVFSSGGGDGFYASYWGLDAAGEPLVLLTDFQMVENGDARNDYERANAAALAALTPEQNAAIAAAQRAIRDDDLTRLEQLLKDGLSPDSYVVESGLTLPFEAIRYLKPKALELLARRGAKREFPEGMVMDVKTYPDYARRMAASIDPDSQAAKDFIEVARRWDAGELAP